MSTSMISSYEFAGIPIFITDVLGSILNITVFLSLRTFRQSSCALYLTVISFVKIRQLFSGMLSRILTGIYDTDGSETSLFLCKFRTYFTVVCTTTSMQCFSLATIDQYCATCSRPRFQQWRNIKLARRLIITFIIIWILHAIPYLVLSNHIISPTTSKIACTVASDMYIQYRAYVVGLLYSEFIPISISVLFGSMAYHNAQQLAYYTVPLVRRELHKQLTVMVLVQVVVGFFPVLPRTIVNAPQLNADINSNPVIKLI